MPCKRRTSPVVLRMAHFPGPLLYHPGATQGTERATNNVLDYGINKAMRIYLSCASRVTEPSTEVILSSASSSREVRSVLWQGIVTGPASIEPSIVRSSISGSIPPFGL